MAGSGSPQVTGSAPAGVVRALNAAGYLVAAGLTGALVGSLSLPRPQQLVGSAPWVTDVSPQLLGAVLATGAVFSLVSLGWLRRIAPGLGPLRRVSLAVGLVATSIVAAWSGLYAASLGGEAVIPILNWTWPAVATAVANGVVGSQYGAWAGLTAGLIGVAPVVALDAIGWAMYGGVAMTGLEFVLILDGSGIVIGSLFALLGAILMPQA